MRKFERRRRKRKRGRKRWRSRDLRAILTSVDWPPYPKGNHFICNPFRWKWDLTGWFAISKLSSPPYSRERNSEENARDHYIRSGDVYRARLLELYLHRRICHCSGSFESRATFGIFSLFLWNPNNREMTRLSRGNFDRIPLWWINYSNTIWEDIILYKFGCLLINYTILYYIQIKVLYSQDLPFKIFTNTIVSRKIRKRIFRCDSWRKRGQAETGGG